MRSSIRRTRSSTLSAMREGQKWKYCLQLRGETYTIRSCRQYCNEWPDPPFDFAQGPHGLINGMKRVARSAVEGRDAPKFSFVIIKNILQQKKAALLRQPLFVESTRCYFRLNKPSFNALSAFSLYSRATSNDTLFALPPEETIRTGISRSEVNTLSSTPA